MDRPTPAHERFSTTPRGAVARARSRRARLLIGLAALMAAVAVATFFAGRIIPGLLALAAAVAPLLAWRWTSDGDLLWLDLGPDELRIQLRGGRERLALAGASARRLDENEIRHLESLIAGSGFGAGCGSFDSRLLGEVDLFATDLERAVLVTSGEQAAVVTPDETQRFVDRLETRAASASAARGG